MVLKLQTWVSKCNLVMHILDRHNWSGIDVEYFPFRKGQRLPPSKHGCLIDPNPVNVQKGLFAILQTQNREFVIEEIVHSGSGMSVLDGGVT